jgi:hypothetical protein
VLVNYAFMNNKNFFYPRPHAERFVVDNIHYSTNDANIILSDIPYVKMRYQVPEALLEGTAGFQETVQKIQRFNEPATVKLYLYSNIVVLNGIVIQLSPRLFAFYLWFCIRQKDDLAPLDLEKDDFIADFLDVFKRFISKNSSRYEYIENMLCNPDDDERTARLKATKSNRWFKNARSTKLHAALRNVLGKYYALPFYIEQLDQGKAVFQLDVEADRIEIVREEYQG